MLPASNNRYWSCPQSASISEILWDALRFTRSRISPATNRFFFCIFGALLEMLFWDSFRFLEPVKPSPSHGFNLFLSSSFLSWFCLALKLCFLFQVLLGMLSRWFTDLTRLIETSAVSLSPSYAPSDFQGFFEMMLGGGREEGDSLVLVRTPASQSLLSRVIYSSSLLLWLSFPLASSWWLQDSL